MPIVQDGKLARTPQDVDRSCTDCCCLLAFAAVLGGLVFCIYTAFEKGDISRLESLPDYQGTQCVGKYVFFPQEADGLNLLRQVCVDSCPTSSDQRVTTILIPERRLSGSLIAATGLEEGAGVAETNSLLMGQGLGAGVTAETPAPATAPDTDAAVAQPPPTAAPETTQAPVPITVDGQVTLMGYPTIPMAGVLCFPEIGRYQGQILNLMGSNEFFEIALEVNNLSQNPEVLVLAAVVGLILSFIFLCLVELFGLLLIRICIVALVTVPATFGLYCLQLWYQGTANAIGTQVASYSGGYISDEQGLLVTGTAGIGISVIFGLLACCQCTAIMKAAEAAQEAADCLMTMPTLLLEPFLSLAFKVPVFVAGVVLFMVLLTSGDYGAVNLANPYSLFNADDLALTCAVYEAFVFLWLMEILHYISIFVVIYTAEVWYFKHYGTSRTNFCGACGPTVMFQGYCAAITSHLGSLIYASFLMTALRVVRWFVKAILSAQEAMQSNPVTSCIVKGLKYFTDCCLGCVQQIMDLTSQVALMDIAYHGDSGFCAANEHALEVIFENRTSWVAVEGMSYFFIAIGVAAVGSGNCVLMYMLTSTLARYSDSASDHHVSDPRELAVVSGVIGVLMAITVLHHFDTIADTMAYCHGFRKYEEKKASVAQAEEASYSNCYGCWHKQARETDYLILKRKEEVTAAK